MGGTMRLGADPIKLHPDTRAREIYGEAVIYERHRHRYEVNNFLRKRLEAAGLVISGTSPDERLVEIIELADHPFFVASQFHPEFKSRPERPAPLFRDFVGAALERAPRAPSRPRRRRRPSDRRAHGRRRGASRRCQPREARQRGRARRGSHETFAALCRDPQPVRARARVRRPRRRRAARHGPRGRGGRRRRARRRRVRQPARPHRRGAAPSAPSCCARTSTPSTHDGADRARGRRRRLGERQRRDPRRRQQGGGRGDARGRPRARAVEGAAGRARAAVHRLRGERAARAPRRSTRAACARDFGYVFDHATPIGEVIVASPTYYRLEADFHGRAAHAGIRPEDGRSAILAAARAIAAMPLGRIDEQTTANVGTIAGRRRLHERRPRALPAARRGALAGPRRGRRGGRRRDGRRRPRRRHDGRVRRRRRRASSSSTATASARRAPAVAAAEAALRACGYEPGADHHRRRLGRQRAAGRAASRA